MCFVVAGDGGLAGENAADPGREFPLQIWQQLVPDPVAGDSEIVVGRVISELQPP